MLFGETVTVYTEREREREERKWGVIVRDTTKGGRGGNIIFYLKVPRQCPLVLLIGVRLEFRVNLTFFFKLLKLEGLH
jgi:hypothetical protein